jgi:hypothetical protein
MEYDKLFIIEQLPILGMEYSHLIFFVSKYC